MYNSRKEKSAGVLSAWERSRKAIEELKSAQKMDMYSQKKDLDLNMFSRACVPGEIEAWELCMCLPYGVANDIVFNAGFLPKKEVKSIAIGSYTLDEEEEELFEMLYDYGKGLGVKKVGMVLMDRASDGDLKACDLYLKYMGMMGEIGGRNEDEKEVDTNINIFLDDGGIIVEGEVGEVGEVDNVVALPKEID